MHVVIFEDSHWPSLAPFSLSRPAFALVTGMTTLLRKQVRRSRASALTLWVRAELTEYCRREIVPQLGIATKVNVPLEDEAALLINGRAVLSAGVDGLSDQAVCTVNGQVLAAIVRRPGLTAADPLGQTERWTALLDLPPMATPGHLVPSPVDLIYLNEQSLVEDFAHLNENRESKPAGPYHLVNEHDIWLGQGTILAPGVVLDASRGPIILGPGADIGANAVVQGPCSIGAGSAIAPLANVRGGVSIGPKCKLGGEVSASIVLGHSNKGHEGFLGHSYLGQWVNLGAGTTTSNLKNTYGDITLARGKTELHTGRKFLGSLIGDHAKTAILTRLMGGTYIGYCAMIAMSNVTPRFVPSFSFLTDKGLATYQRDKAIEVARRVFARRQREWTGDDERMMEYIARIAPQVEQT